MILSKIKGGISRLEVGLRSLAAAAAVDHTQKGLAREGTPRICTCWSPESPVRGCFCISNAIVFPKDPLASGY